MNTIELTNEQYETLIKLSFIGEWVLNAQHSKTEFEEEQELVNYLYSHCNKFNLKKHFNRHGEDWELKEDVIFGILPVIEEFSYKDFWSILVAKLSERDVIENSKSINLKEIEDEEYEMMMDKEATKYMNEFEQHGVNNLRLKNVRNN